MPPSRNCRVFHLLGALTLMGAVPMLAESVQGAGASQPLTARRQGQAWTVTLSPALQRAVSTRFPGYALPLRQAFSADLLQFLSETPEKRSVVPCACTGDFDGNGLTDAALL